MTWLHLQLRVTDNEGRLDVKKAAEELQVRLEQRSSMRVHSA